MNIQIPTELSNKADYPQVKKLDRQIISAAVLLGLSNQDAFKLYHPEYLDSKGNLNDAGKQDSKFFWNYGKNKEYREQFEKEIEEFFGKGKKTTASDNSDSRKDKALNKLMSDCLDAIDSNASLDPEILKDIVVMAKALGVLKDETEKQTPALRFLPAKCKTECNYCFFIETAKAKKLMFDSCDYCKARKIAEEHGFKFDHCTLLEVPAEVVAEFEAKNNVNLMDIINNGQQTRADIEEQFNKLDTNG